MSAALQEKTELVARLARSVREDLEALRRAHEVTAQGVTHEDARSEGDKDMRSTEASYVARGQALRVVELEDELAALLGLQLRTFAAGAPAALGALVTIELDDGESDYFIAPAGAGRSELLGERRVRIVTPRSPLGRALLGRTVDDDVEWQTPQGEVGGTIVAIW